MRRIPAVPRSSASWPARLRLSLPTAIVLVVQTTLFVPSSLAGQTGDLDGIIDLHAHAAPDSRGPRSVNAFEAARLAQRHGMRAMLLKNHYTETASQAYLVSQLVPGIELYGGIVLNRSVGGINPAAVANMAAITGNLGRMVWLPTFDSENNAPGSENVPVTREGVVLPEVRRVFEVMQENDLALATGHIRPEESLLVIREARAAGIDRIIVTHPSSALVGMSADMQREAASMGALLEYTLNAVQSAGGFDDLVTHIREVGPENVVITTDLGQVGNPVHADGMRAILPRLAAAGFSRSEIDTMTKRNPARVLGLSP